MNKIKMQQKQRQRVTGTELYAAAGGVFKELTNCGMNHKCWTVTLGTSLHTAQHNSLKWLVVKVVNY